MSLCDESDFSADFEFDYFNNNKGKKLNCVKDRNIMMMGVQDSAVLK